MRVWITPLIWRVAVVVPLVLPTAFEGFDAISRQQLFRWRGPRDASDRVVVIGVDEASLDPALADFGPWPWPRSVQAELAAHVLDLGAKQVIFNIVHSGPSGYGPADDDAFVETLQPWTDQVVLSASYVRQLQGDLEQVQLKRPHASGFPNVGLSSFTLDHYGIVAAIPGKKELQRLMSSFAPPHPKPLAHVAAGTSMRDGDDGIDFIGPAGHIPVIPAWMVESMPEDSWIGQQVIIGATAPSLGDQLETPFGQVSGSEVLYAALAGELEDRGFRRPEQAALIGLLILWGLIGLWRLGTGGAAATTVKTSLGLTAFAAGGTVLAWCTGVWLPGAALMLSPLLGGSVRASVQFRRESRQRRFLHSVLSRRVSPTLMDDMVRSGETIWTQLGGRKTRCVVLFTDLVGFTARSSTLEPSALFTLLNRYFEAIAGPVLKEQGLLDKFIGDSLMAEFGVPHHRGDKEEALAAVRAALQMRDNLQQLNKELQLDGQEPLSQGIGLHFGEVMAGNLGSSHRLEYTVIGATVNVASRLEGLTRQFDNHSILISGELRDLLGDSVEVTDLGAQKLKGWPNPMRVFALQKLAHGPSLGFQ